MRKSFPGFAAIAAVVIVAACSASTIGTAVASRAAVSQTAVSHDSTPAAAAVASAPPARLAVRPAVRVAVDSSTLTLHRAIPAPTPSHRHDRSGTFGGIGLLGAALATKRVKNSRKKTGRALSIPQILDSHVHVARENDKGEPITVQHDAGTLVDDTDLTDDEIDELTARRAIRNATQEDLDHLAAADPASAAQTSTGGDAGGAEITDE